MSRPAITVGTEIRCTPEELWKEVQEIASHPRWMTDAKAIRFLTPDHHGVGTRFECHTQVGPFRLMDVMEITEWEPNSRMGVRHVGLVEGNGIFTLKLIHDTTTWFEWEEGLIFPWFLGGRVGALLARPILRAVWNKNLARLKALVEEP